MKKILGVIFDKDGVIFDTEKMSADFWTKTMKKYGVDMDRETYTKVMGRNRQGVIDGVKEIYGHLDLDIEKIANEKTEAMVKQLDENPIPILPGVDEIIKYLKENNYKIGLATSTRKFRAEKRLKKENLYNHFEALMYGDEVEKSKPNPEIFLKVCEKLGLKPEECLVLEDSPSGVEAAYNGGFPCINVVDIKQPTEDTKSKCIAICNNLYEVIEWLEKNNSK